MNTLLTLILCATGDVIPYNSFAEWDAVAGSGRTVEDFESFATDTSYYTGPLTLNGLTLSTLTVRGQPYLGQGNIIDVAPTLHADYRLQGNNVAIADIFGTPAYRGEPLTLHNVLQFDTPVSAWSAMFGAIHNANPLTLDLYDGGRLVETLERTDWDSRRAATNFLGFTTTDPVDRVVFRTLYDPPADPNAPSNNLFAFDNVTMVGAPEPGTVALSCLIVAVLCVWYVIRIELRFQKEA